MALSYAQYSANGSNRDYSVPFKYIDKRHVLVLVNGISVTFGWATDYVVRTVTAAPVNSIVTVKRDTPKDAVLVDYVDGSTLTETDLDLGTIQNFFLAQEAYDMAQGTLTVNADGSYSAGGRNIGQVADPVGPQNAATKNYVDTAMTSQVAQATTARSAAATSASQAAGSATTATTQANTATSAATSAVAARDAASTHRANAQTAQGKAETAQVGAEAAFAKLGNEVKLAEAAREGAQGARTEVFAARDTAAGYVSTVENRAAAAENARTSALTAKDTAVAAKDTAVSSSTTATTKAQEAETSRNAAVNAQTAAASSATLAQAWASAPTNTDVAGASTRSAFHYAIYCQQQGTQTLTLRNEAESFRNAAETFAKNAEKFDPATYYTKVQADGRYLGLTGGNVNGQLALHYANPAFRMSNPNVRAWYWHVNSSGTFRLVDETAQREVFFIGVGGNANFWGDVVYNLSSAPTSLTAAMAMKIDRFDRYGVTSARFNTGGSLSMTTGNHADFHWSNGFYYRVDNNQYTLINSSPSDGRFKNVEGPVKDALDQVRALKPVTYDFKAGLPLQAPKGVRPGFVAQELADVLPNAVQITGIPDADKNDAYGPSFRSLTQDAPIQLIALLTKAVQELASQLDTMRPKEA